MASRVRGLSHWPVGATGAGPVKDTQMTWSMPEDACTDAEVVQPRMRAKRPMKAIRKPGAMADPESAAPSGWSTSSFGHAPDTSPQELRALGEHLHRCRGVGGRLFALRCGVESARAFLARRIVTTLVLAALIAAAALLVA